MSFNMLKAKDAYCFCDVNEQGDGWTRTMGRGGQKQAQIDNRQPLLADSTRALSKKGYTLYDDI